MVGLLCLKNIVLALLAENHFIHERNVAVETTLDNHC